MTEPRVDPALFRALAFERDWLAALRSEAENEEIEFEVAPPDDAPPGTVGPIWVVTFLAGRLHAEAVEWRRLGESLGVFAQPQPVIGEALPPNVTVVTFARALDEARDDLTPERREFLYLTMFSDEREWNERLAQLRAAAQALRRHPALNLPAAIADDLGWGLVGGETRLAADEWPSSWRSDASVRSHHPDRLAEFDEVRDELLDAAEGIVTASWIALQERAQPAQRQARTQLTTDPAERTERAPSEPQGTLRYFAAGERREPPEPASS